MQSGISADQLVRSLRGVGLRPDKRLVDQIVAYDAAAIEPLLALALDVERLGQEEPASLGPVHALRLLGELRAADAAEPILRKLPLPDYPEPTQAVYLWEQEAPQIVARMGAVVYPVIIAIASDEDAHAEQRGAAIETLAYLSATVPELRDQIVDQLQEWFEQFADPTLRAYVVQALADMGVKQMYSAVMAAYREGSIDRDVITAADARQMLLGSVKSRRIDCANHTLDERYEQHGPFSEEQRQAMAEMQRSRGQSY